MPTYEYECNSCRHRFEKRQSFNDSPVAECPVCQCSSRRVFFPAPIIFKGSGFYVTDSRRPGTGGNGDDSETRSQKTAAGKESGETGD